MVKAQVIAIDLCRQFRIQPHVTMVTAAGYGVA